ncbi:hypothetical protein DFQ27_005690 [Actinomortierella ambigua]|uniref:Indoleamine 2,3-dioxygenase n=1 Tax=Actinomortierella ambigua TaxID=1343610 RepID=A0A9P6Q010_9FUNG|nr:hypothetical protein DFQ27_005690 [Actinomortierella ambigua]
MSPTIASPHDSESPRRLPVLEDYDISPVTGFLPVDEPLGRLPDPYFAPWEQLFDQFNGLLLANRLRQRCNELPILDATRLTTKPEQRRAYLMLCFLSHGYVWGKHEVASETLPAALAVPWQTVADLLEIQPVLTHAAVVMWNWRLLYKDGPRDLSNIETLATASGSADESWFYLVTTAIEARGAPALSKILRAFQAVRDNDMATLTAELDEIQVIIADLVAILRRMFEKCDPYVFYWKVRPYLAGWENMAEAGLPNGVRYEGVDNGEYKKLAGGSAAQSSLIHALDIAFGVEHYPTGFRPKAAPGAQPAATTATTTTTTTTTTTAPSSSSSSSSASDSDSSMDGPKPTSFNSYNLPAKGVSTTGQPAKGSSPNNFIQKMRFYMPGPHRSFLTHLTEVANIRQYVLDKANAEPVGARSAAVAALVKSFDECVHQIKVFRDVHIQIVTLYIVMQANRGPSISHGGFHPGQAAKAAPSSETPADAKSNIMYPQRVIFAPHGLAKKQEKGNNVVRGTGGTDVLPFLKQSRTETNEAKVDLQTAY